LITIQLWILLLLNLVFFVFSANALALRSKTSPRRPTANRPISQSSVADDEVDGDADGSSVKGSSAANEIGSGSAAGYAKTQPDEEDGLSGSGGGIGGGEEGEGASGSAGSSAGSGFVKNEEEVLGPNGHPLPEPYSFSYSADTDDGASSTREETGDKDGTITGKSKRFIILLTT
jgi:hypothetical protein